MSEFSVKNIFYKNILNLHRYYDKIIYSDIRKENIMNYIEYVNKVRACWLGKNIGGTLGAPLECRRGLFEVDYYLHDISQGVLPNDDLDLQIVWLNAAEKFGCNVNSEILANYWLMAITPEWSEYGAGKANLRNGILPPASGKFENLFKDSCGCFIRSEIWACLAPGRPDIAVKYAYEDACVDHADDGIYAELFCAAVQSAAFTESDRDKLIDIGLSYIPADCAIAGAINFVRKCYADGDTWQTARKKLLCEYPATFGMAFGPEEEGVPMGNIGFDAPSNIGIIIIGWLYGENDFSKSICIAAACGEDADCTAGTLAATLGIIIGTDNIDEKWKTPIGDEIKTVTLDRTGSVNIPSTVSLLTARVAKLMTVFMNQYISFNENGEMDIKTLSGDALFLSKERTAINEYLDKFPYMYNTNVIAKNYGQFFDMYISSDKNIEIIQDEEKVIDIFFMNKVQFQYWVSMTLHMPAEWEIKGGLCHSLSVKQYNSGTKRANSSLTFIPHSLTKAKYEVTLEIEIAGFASKVFVPLTLIVK